MATVLTIETPGLGDRSYLAHDGEVALVVDPQRDHGHVFAVAEQAGVRIHARVRVAHPQRLRHRWLPARPFNRDVAEPSAGRTIESVRSRRPGPVR